MVEFSALGGLSVTEEGSELIVGGPRQRRLLAMLLIHRNTVVSVDRLADAVFAGEPTPAATTTLRSYIARIRRVVDRDGSMPSIVTKPPGYELRIGPEAFDVSRFERMLKEARVRRERGDPSAAAVELREALELWRGDPYAEFADEDWAGPEAQRLSELRLVAVEWLGDAELELGHAADLIPRLQAETIAHPLREAYQAQFALALYRAGRQTDALRALREYRRSLDEEVGLAPSPGLVELERRILDHEPTLLVAAPATVPLRGYRLGARLGSGRDSTLFDAELPGVARDVVVRAVRAEVADEPAFIRSFEARLNHVVGLRHPAVVPIYDYWREPGAAYVVERRMHGGTLAARLATGPLDAASLADLASRVGSAPWPPGTTRRTTTPVTKQSTSGSGAPARSGEPCPPRHSSRRMTRPRRASSPCANWSRSSRSGTQRRASN